MVTRESQTLTVDAFWDTYAGKPYELINGRVIEVSPADGESPSIGAIVTAHITLYVMKHNLGVVTNAEGGYWLNPTTLRAPDVGFYGWEKHKLHTNPNAFRPFPPELAVEIVSPTDLATDVKEKVDLYIEAGVRLIWVVFPESRSIAIYDSAGNYASLSLEDTLNGGDVLPGFSVPVKDCFPAPPPQSD